MDATALRAATLAMTAWIVALVCAGASAWHVRNMRRWRSPGVDALVQTARAESSSVAFARSELEQVARDAERRLSLGTLLPRSLARVALASGTAVAILLLAVVRRDLPTSVPAALAAFVGGLVGSLVSATFGRQAKAVAADSRSEWRRHLAEAKRALV